MSAVSVDCCWDLTWKILSPFFVYGTACTAPFTTFKLDHGQDFDIPKDELFLKIRARELDFVLHDRRFLEFIVPSMMQLYWCRRHNTITTIFMQKTF